MRRSAPLFALALVAALCGCGGGLGALDVRDSDAVRQAYHARELAATKTLVAVPADADVFGQVRIPEVMASRVAAPYVATMPEGVALADVVATYLIAGEVNTLVRLPGPAERLEFAIFGDLASQRGARLRAAYALFGSFEAATVASLLEGGGWAAASYAGGACFTHPTRGASALLDGSCLVFATDEETLAKVAATRSGRLPSVMSGGRVREAFSPAMDRDAPLVEVFFPVSHSLKRTVRRTLERSGPALAMLPGLADLLAEVANVNTGRLGLVEVDASELACVLDLRMVDEPAARRTAKGVPSTIASVSRTVRVLGIGGDEVAEVLRALRRITCSTAAGSDTVRLTFPVSAEDLLRLRRTASK